MLNKLTDHKGARLKSKRLGRGIGSGKGKTCARGGKGQTARSGVAIAGFEGGQMPLYRRVPKRGFNSLNQQEYAVVNFDTLNELIAAKKIPANDITLDDLKKCGIVRGIASKLKLLGAGKLDKPINIEVHAASKAAEASLVKIGGKITFVK